MVTLPSTIALSSHSTSRQRPNAITETTTTSPSTLPIGSTSMMSRRNTLLTLGGAAALFGGPVNPANAATDCMKDCLQNCKKIAPKDPGYCLENCKGYCDQDDRNDGLSGSVSSSGGEMGILGTYTVVKGEDKPPTISIPGLDFSSEKGKKLLGY
mmetsp:Transcript_19954/g.28261  ORF Transcript_19954/g.28261 Transcript_19954/m.28261 type:complete len:155 (-) Transcript_19954:144-608(-)